MTPEIIDLPDNALIDAPGLYRCSIDHHHGQPTVGVSVTSGILRKMTLETPADVWAYSVLNPNRYPKKETDALRMGRAMAAYVEGGMEAVAKHFRVLPKGCPRRPTEAQRLAWEEGRASEAAKESIAFWDEIAADGRAVISVEDMALILDMGEALAADPGSALLEGLPEITMAWECEETGLWVLSRPDCINFDGTASDYKRLSTQGRPFNHRVCDARIEQHGYHQQMALAAEAMERLGLGWPTQVGLVFQWDQPPYHVVVREIEEEALRYGQHLNRRARLRFAECLASGRWPGPGDDIGIYRMSPAMRERMNKDMMEGSTP